MKKVILSEILVLLLIPSIDYGGTKIFVHNEDSVAEGKLTTILSTLVSTTQTDW